MKLFALGAGITFLAVVAPWVLVIVGIAALIKLWR